jgi:hypothetical protein
LNRDGPVSWDPLASTGLAAASVLLAVCHTSAATLPVHALPGALRVARDGSGFTLRFWVDGRPAAAIVEA